MLRRDYSRSLREARNLPEDVGRMINYYTYFTPEEEFLYLAVDLLNLMNSPKFYGISNQSRDNVKINSENIKSVVDYLKFNFKNSFQDFLDSFSDRQLYYGTPLHFSKSLVYSFPDLLDTTVLPEPEKMVVLMDNFLLNRGKNEGIIRSDESLKDFFKRLD